MMTRIFLVGSKPYIAEYIDSYLSTNKFLPHEIQVFDLALKVEEIRQISKHLAFKVNGQKLLIFNCTFTTAAQNALLKCVEESDENIHFIFTGNHENDLLPTLRSRCSQISLSRKYSIDRALYDLADCALKKDDCWEEVILLSEKLKELDLDALIPVMRKLLLENYDGPNTVKYYKSCKKILEVAPLSKNNNVNKGILLESVFLASI